MSTSVLIIEDDTQSLETLENLLERQNFDTLTALNGRSGIRLARECKPDIILCDGRVPAFEGSSLLNALRKDESTASIPFILMGQHESSHCETIAPDRYLNKPFTPEQLLEAIAVCLEKYQRLQQHTALQDQSIRSLEQQVQKSRELAEAYLFLLDKFSQELRQPISNMHVAVQLLKKDHPEDTRSEEFSILEDECMRSVSLLNEVVQLQERVQASRTNVLQQMFPTDQLKEYKDNWSQLDSLLMD